MIEALRLAREYGVAVEYMNLGEWSDGELRAEYDPTVPEIRVNRAIAETMPSQELERFIALAVGHELYHHREHIGEIATLPERTGREDAADAYALVLFRRCDGRPPF